MDVNTDRHRESLRAFRRYHGLSLPEMAEPMGIDKHTLSKILNGKLTLTLGHAMRFLVAFGLREYNRVFADLPVSESKPAPNGHG